MSEHDNSGPAFPTVAGHVVYSNGMTLRDWAQLTMPVLVFRSSETDLSHTRATSEWVHRLVPHSRSP